MNTTTAAERAAILARAEQLVKLDRAGAVINLSTTRQQLVDEFHISRERAIGAIAKAARRMRHPTHARGTAPDTSLALGQARRAWLIRQGGIQPTVRCLVDEAMAG